jgi:hypothetical protein
MVWTLLIFIVLESRSIDAGAGGTSPIKKIFPEP